MRFLATFFSGMLLTLSATCDEYTYAEKALCAILGIALAFCAVLAEPVAPYLPPKPRRKR